MKLGKAIAKVEKALELKMQQNSNGTYWAQYDEYVISFFGNGGNSMDHEASCLHVRRENDHSDP